MKKPVENLRATQIKKINTHVAFEWYCEMFPLSDYAMHHFKISQ